jgi:hypothetical protein
VSHRERNSSGKALARELVARGALWDSSIIAARAVVLLSVLRARMPDLADQMETARGVAAVMRRMQSAERSAKASGHVRRVISPSVQTLMKVEQ